MKNLYLVGGTMGVGKTTVCKLLKAELPNSVFLDGDWCWDMNPFQVTEETKAMVLDNICHQLNNFLACTAFDNVIFCWVMHEQAIIDHILSRLATEACAIKNISLVCGQTALEERLQKDVALGIRMPDVIGRSVARLALYETLHTIKIDVSGKTPGQVVGLIEQL